MTAVFQVHTEQHWNQLRELSKELQLFEQSIRPERKPFLEISQGSFQYLKDNVTAKNGIALLALDDKNNAIGFLTGWVVDSDGLDSGCGQVGEISDAYIKPAYRNFYTFKTMGRIAAQHFAAKGLDRLTFSTLATNTRMQELFIKSGFKPHKVSFEIKLIDP